MSPFGNGRAGGAPERRRKDTSRPGGERDDDPTVELARRFVWWGKMYATHKATVSLLLMGAAAAATWIGVAAMIEPRVAKLEKSMASVEPRIAKLERSEDSKMFMLCTIYRRTDSLRAMPKLCDDFMTVR